MCVAVVAVFVFCPLAGCIRLSSFFDVCVCACVCVSACFLHCCRALFFFLYAACKGRGERGVRLGLTPVSVSFGPFPSA
ncbi:hypothetical protein TRSC58_07579 [Trypanosoma rangeli SC58]|uniref:Secreted protein n=1 Tax=Trypanosoma rangeli SC58 TaxID=429131 RepID=A0A061IUY8_TRYRA|nr:hypothetical protein TRSC58_07579 [Trypanosoma rangeli SC58]